MTTEQFNRIFQRIIISHYGVPKGIISDRDRLFTSKMWKGITDMLGIERRMSTVFHPQTEEQTERVNQTLEQYKRMYINEKQDNWVELLPVAMMTYNNTKSDATGYSPYFANYGREMENLSSATSKNPYAVGRVEDMVQLQEALAEDLKFIARRMKEKEDLKRKYVQIEKGERVYLNTRNIE